MTKALPKGHALKNEVGNIYGRLVVIFVDRTRKAGCVYWKCLCDCGRIISTRGTSLRNGTTESCGCLNKDILKSQTKERNPCWRGGKTKTGQGIRFSKEYALWREEVRQLHDYTCKKCKKRGGALIVHHIKNFSSFKEGRMKLSNAIVFCKECHLDFHNQYGRYDNNYMQIVKFVTGDLSNAFFTECT